MLLLHVFFELIRPVVQKVRASCVQTHVLVIAMLEAIVTVTIGFSTEPFVVPLTTLLTGKLMGLGSRA